MWFTLLSHVPGYRCSWKGRGWDGEIGVLGMRKDTRPNENLLPLTIPNTFVKHNNQSSPTGA